MQAFSKMFAYWDSSHKFDSIICKVSPRNLAKAAFVGQ